VNDRLRVLVMGGTWPHRAGNVQAADVVPYEIARCLAAEGFDVAVACVGFAEPPVSAAARAGLAELQQLGVRLLPFIKIAPPPGSNSALRKWWRLLIQQDPAALIPGYGQSAPILSALTAANWTPHVAIPIWNYEATAAAADLPCILYPIYGNPDDKVYLANLRLMWQRERRLSAGWLGRYLADRLRIAAVGRAHLAMLNRFELVAQNAANDYEYYRSAGVSGVHYLRNMWPAPVDEAWAETRDRVEQIAPLKIAGNVGHLNATANSFGLLAIGEEIVPALRRRLGDGTFEMHIYGRNNPRPFIARTLRDPHIKLRGFVEDIDGELLSCPIFLLANNRYDFKVGHTRILHAFALGACVVAYRDTAIAMPELMDGKNILLADDGPGIAEQIARAAADAPLRRRLARAGIDTLRTLFRPETVVEEMAALIRAEAARGGKVA